MNENHSPLEAANASALEASSRLAALHQRLSKAADRISVLPALEWPGSLQAEFLRGWEHGNARPPLPTLPPIEVTEPQRELEQLLSELDESQPLEGLLAKNARNYLEAARLLEVRGSPEFTRISIRLYGDPSRIVPGTRTTSSEAALNFMEAASDFAGADRLLESEYCIPASAIRDYLIESMEPVLGRDAPRVELDPNLSAKAAAGARRIRLRDQTSYSKYDGEQLLQHEAFVHSLTALNGRFQSPLSSLGDGAPRTTATQEGLATFSELVTGAMDLARLKRLALRVQAIQKALSGADFLEVFRTFHQAGQSPAESYHSTRRIFRGGNPEGGSVFTKDGAYVEGLLRVWAFFHTAFRQQKMELAEVLFTGRMDLDDVSVLAQAQKEGILKAPRYLPPWMTRREALSAFLAFSGFASRVNLDEMVHKDSSDSRA